MPRIDGRFYLLLAMLCGLLSLGGCSGAMTDVTGAKVAGAVYRAPPLDPTRTSSQNEGWQYDVIAPKLPFDADLTLREAINRALRYSPALQAASLEVEAKLGVAAQAAVRPNPVLSLDVENFGGTGDLGGLNSAEGTLALSQLVELGGKRYRRLAVANLDRAVSVWDFEAARLRVIRETAEAFIDALAIQEAIARSTEANRIARELERDVQARVDAGQANPIEIQRTRPMVANTLVRLESERARLEPTKRRLASMWGQSRPDFARVSGNFSRTTRVRSIDAVLGELESNPDVARWSDEIARRDAVVELELAKSVPDITLGAGVRRLNDTNDTALVASASLPLPIFDRNSGNIAAAEARLSKAEYERSSSLATLRVMVLSAYEDLASSAAEVRALADDVVPPARSAYRAVQTSFKAGASQLLDVLDARRVLFEAELNLIRAQANFEKAKARIEGLTGRKI